MRSRFQSRKPSKRTSLKSTRTASRLWPDRRARIPSLIRRRPLLSSLNEPHHQRWTVGRATAPIDSWTILVLVASAPGLKLRNKSHQKRKLVLPSTFVSAQLMRKMRHHRNMLRSLWPIIVTKITMLKVRLTSISLSALVQWKREKNLEHSKAMQNSTSRCKATVKNSVSPLARPLRVSERSCRRMRLEQQRLLPMEKWTKGLASWAGLKRMDWRPRLTTLESLKR